MDTADYLSKLPTDTWTRCWNYCSHDELPSLSETCRAFYDICRPILFSTCTFKVKISTDRSPGKRLAKTHNIQRFIERVRALIISENDIVELVHRWKIHGNLDLQHGGHEFMAGFHPCVRKRTEDKAGTNADDIRRYNKYITEAKDIPVVYRKIVTVFACMLPRFSNLHTLELHEWDLDANFRRALNNLWNLRHLDIGSCRFVATDGNFEPLNLQTFRANKTTTKKHLGRGRRRNLRFLSPECLETLVLVDRDSTEMFLPGIVTNSPCPSLKNLTLFISPQISRYFIDFLSRCPQLETLCIQRNSSIRRDLRKLKPHVLPVLKSFTGPIGWAKFFVPGRTVESVSLWSTSKGLKDDDIPPLLADIHESSVPLRSLALPQFLVGPLVFHYIAILHPHLKALELALTMCDENTVMPEDHQHADDNLVSVGNRVDEVVTTVVDGKRATVNGNGYSTYAVREAWVDQRLVTLFIKMGSVNTPRRSLRFFGGLLDWIALNRLPFPPQLEQLILFTDDLNFFPPVLEDDQRLATVAKLSTAIPNLQRIALGNCELGLDNDGLDSAWVRCDGSWNLVKVKKNGRV